MSDGFFLSCWLLCCSGIGYCSSNILVFVCAAILLLVCWCVFWRFDVVADILIYAPTCVCFHCVWCWRDEFVCGRVGFCFGSFCVCLQDVWFVRHEDLVYGSSFYFQRCLILFLALYVAFYLCLDLVCGALIWLWRIDMLFDVFFFWPCCVLFPLCWVMFRCVCMCSISLICLGCNLRGSIIHNHWALIVINVGLTTSKQHMESALTLRDLKERNKMIFDERCSWNGGVLFLARNKTSIMRIPTIFLWMLWDEQTTNCGERKQKHMHEMAWTTNSSWIH